MKPAGVVIVLSLVIGTATSALAQGPEADARQRVIEEAQAQKSQELRPYVPSKGERLITKLENRLEFSTQMWHPFLDNAYSGGGFALGAGYMRHVSAYSTIDVRGSYSIKNYKRVEAEFSSPRLFNRRGELSVLGGWRDATQVAFYGVGPDTSSASPANYGFERPSASALLTLRPTRRLLMLRGGLEVSRWNLKSGAGSDPRSKTSSRQRNCLDYANTTYVHSQVTAGLIMTVARLRAPGGFYGLTAHVTATAVTRGVPAGPRRAAIDPARSLGGLVTRPGGTTWEETVRRCRFSCCPRSAADPVYAFSAGASRSSQHAAAGGGRIMANRY